MFPPDDRWRQPLGWSYQGSNFPAPLALGIRGRPLCRQQGEGGGTGLGPGPSWNPAGPEDLFTWRGWEQGGVRVPRRPGPVGFSGEETELTEGWQPGGWLGRSGPGGWAGTLRRGTLGPGGQAGCPVAFGGRTVARQRAEPAEVGLGSRGWAGGRERRRLPGPAQRVPNPIRTLPPERAAPGAPGEQGGGRRAAGSRAAPLRLRARAGGPALPPAAPLVLPPGSGAAPGPAPSARAHLGPCGLCARAVGGLGLAVGPSQLSRVAGKGKKRNQRLFPNERGKPA